jgi:lysophospholipase L1-like esterase
LWSDLVRQGLAPRITPPSRWATYRVGVLLLSPWLTARKVKFLDQKGDVGDLGDESSRVGLREYRRNLLLLAERAKAGGARPAFLLLPAPMDLDAAVPPETVVAYRATMRSVAAELGAPLVDGEALVDARSATLAWWDDQVHPSALGHKELGVALAEALAPHRP